MKSVAADYDGVWDIHPEIHGEVDFIITGNTWEKYDHVMEHAEDMPVYFNPGKAMLMDIVMHKANVINKQNVEKYYEDQPEQVILLRSLCPECRIVLVQNGTTAI